MTVFWQWSMVFGAVLLIVGGCGFCAGRAAPPSPTDPPAAAGGATKPKSLFGLSPASPISPPSPSPAAGPVPPVGSTPAPAAGPAAPAPANPTPKKTRSLDELLLFFPSRYPEGNWKPRDLKFEDVQFTAADKTRLHAWYCPCERPRAALLFAHGNGGNVAHRVELLRYFQTQLQVTALAFDYRGYGRSEGTPTVEGALQDARAARTKLAELAHVKESEIVIMGESLGGAVAVQLAAESPPRALILQSTFSSLREVADVHYPALAWVVPKDRLNSTAAIPKYRGPLLESHGASDRLVPLAHAEKLFQAANEPKRMVRLAGADHNDWFQKNNLTEIEAFLAALAESGK